MPDDYNHNLPKAAYRAALLEELNTPPTSNEKKAAIVAELELLGKRTADEDRAQFETASGANTVGRNPGTGPVPTVGRHADATDDGGH